MMRVVTFECVLCDRRSRGLERWRSGDWRVVQCLYCGLLRTWPVPDLEGLRRRYEHPGYHQSRTAGSGQSDAWRLRAASIVAGLPGTTSSVLDFGAGRGELVWALRERDVEAEGLEPSPRSRREALESHGVELFAAQPPQWSGRFDAVVMLHSLEHVLDPVHTLVGLRGALRPQGRLFVEVPHAGASGMRYSARRAAILDLPLHLHHFTPRTLSLVLARAGYEVEKLRRINTRGVERLLSWRANKQTAVPAPRTGSGRPGGGGASPARTGATGKSGFVPALWAQVVLAGLRRAFPGDVFQIVACAR